MAFIDNWNNASDATFQGRCMGGLWKVCMTKKADSPTPEETNYIQRVMQDLQNITPRVLAMQVLRNATIAADPVNSSDGDLEWQLNQVWDDLLEIN